MIEAPGASGVANEIEPAESELLKAPPFGCEGGCSSVVPKTVIEHGIVAGVPVAAHVAAPKITGTTDDPDVRARRSAIPDGAGNVVWSTIRKRILVIGAPVLFIKRRRIRMVPNVELFAGSEVKSRTRLGGLCAVAVRVSTTTASTSEFR